MPRQTWRLHAACRVVAPSRYRNEFKFHQGEASHNETWWDISSRQLVGGRFRAPNGNPIEIGYVKNNNGTITVYAWRHE